MFITFLFELKGQIEEKNTSLNGPRTHKSRIYFRAEIQKYFGRFLVQMKTVEFAFEIN